MDLLFPENVVVQKRKKIDMVLRRFRFHLFLLATSIFLFGFAHTTLAVGISPVRVLSVLESNTSEERIFYLSRSDASTEEHYTIEASGDFIDLQGETEMVMPVGAQVVPYTFRVNARGLKIGSYTGKIIFSPISVNPIEGASVTFLIRVQGDVILNVVEDVLVPVSQFGRDVTHVRVQNIFVEQVDKEMNVSFQLRNISDAPITAVSYVVELIEASGRSVASQNGLHTDPLIAGDIITKQTQFLLPEVGSYTVRISADTAEQDPSVSDQITFTLSSRTRYVTLIGVATGFLMLIAGVFLLFVKKRS